MYLKEYPLLYVNSILMLVSCGHKPKHKLITIFFKNCFVYLQTGGDDGYYDCEEIPFFEIGSVHYDEYLVNIKLPYARHSNERIGLVSEINFVVSKRS